MQCPLCAVMSQITSLLCYYLSTLQADIGMPTIVVAVFVGVLVIVIVLRKNHGGECLFLHCPIQCH